MIKRRLRVCRDEDVIELCALRGNRKVLAWSESGPGFGETPWLRNGRQDAICSGMGPARVIQREAAEQPPLTHLRDTPLLCGAAKAAVIGQLCPFIKGHQLQRVAELAHIRPCGRAIGGEE